MVDTAVIGLTACEVVKGLESGELQSTELVEAAYSRIEQVDPAVNAIPTLCPERAMAQAEEADRRRSIGEHLPLAGLPIAVKDLDDVAGVRCTHGSPIFADNIPETSDVMVERLEAKGAITLGKSNTPEFGAGANTFNEVFGITRNPWDTSKTCGGSSGGSAVAVATGMSWLATGSDLGGSLRTPAGFCGVVGLRPSPGRIARSPSATAFSGLSVRGPMARTVEDTALMFDAMVGFDPRDPISIPTDGSTFLNACRAGAPPQRIAFTPDLGGIVPVVPEVADLCRKAAQRFSDMGAVVEEASPNFSHATECFQTLRALNFAIGMRDLLENHRDRLKPAVVWNIEKGLALTAEDIARAEEQRTELYSEVSEFFETYDLLCCPTAIVPPFPAETKWVEEVCDHRFDNYIDWIAITYAITLTAHPAISVPAALDSAGLPVGLQLIGPPRGEGKLLAYARHFESDVGFTSRLPIDPKAPH